MGVKLFLRFIIFFLINIIVFIMTIHGFFFEAPSITPLAQQRIRNVLRLRNAPVESGSGQERETTGKGDAPHLERLQANKFIPNIRSLLNVKPPDPYPDMQCTFPHDREGNGYWFSANVTHLNVSTTETTIFKNHIEKVQRKTKEANRLLQQVMSRRGAGRPVKEGKRITSHHFGVNIGAHVYYPGGHWVPRKCVPKWKVAIVIPYRNRTKNLHTLLRNLVPFLLTQELEFGIFIAEQGFSELMNRGMMRNIGYQMAKHSGTRWDCYIFHDVDYVPMNATNYYGCDEFPKHYAIKLEEFNYSNPYIVDFGGVVGLTEEQMDDVNGYSNMYWGWGGEDDDIVSRVRHRNFKVSLAKQGYYRDLPHKKKTSSEKCPSRICLFKSAVKRMDSDGLTAIRYFTNTTSISLCTLYTNISSDVVKAYWNLSPKCQAKELKMSLFPKT